MLSAKLAERDLSLKVSDLFYTAAAVPNPGRASKHRVTWRSACARVRYPQRQRSKIDGHIYNSVAGITVVYLDRKAGPYK